jgi:pyruvate,water dikinase
MYYNMSSIHAILSASPFSGLLIKSFDKFVGYTAETNTVKRKFTLLQKLSFAREFILLNWNLRKNVVEFESIVDAYSKQVKQSVVVGEVRECFHGFIEIRMHSWYRASLADFFAMIYHGLLGKFCSAYYGSEAAGVQNKLIQAIPGLISSKPILDMYALIVQIRNNPKVYEQFNSLSADDFWKGLQQQDSSILEGVNTYLENWGFRCSGELMLTADNYAEKPESFIALLQRYEKLPDQNPEKMIQEKYQEAVRVKHDFRKKILSKHVWFLPRVFLQIGILNFLIKQTSNGIASRERVRLKQAHLYFRFKQVLKKIEMDWMKKDLLQEAGDVLFLTYPEINEHLSASSMLHNTIAPSIGLRKEEFKRMSDLMYPDDFYTSSGIYTTPESVKQKATIPAKEGLLTGMCACGGTIEGRVKVLQTVLEAGKLEKGEADRIA